MPISHPNVVRLAGLLTLIVIVLAGCQPPRASTSNGAGAWQASRQLVLVNIDDWNSDHGSLRTYERSDGGAWREVGASQPVMIGRAGAAWGVGLHRARSDGPIKQEGDNRSPAGVFRIGTAFGYTAQVDTALPYRALTATDYCIDVSGSPQYNRIVDANVVGAEAVKGSTEPMRRDLHADGDPRYRLGFVIEHNPQARAQAGSCIFAHLWQTRGEATAGCTAMAPALMQSLLAWLKPEQQPIFMLLPRDAYLQLQHDVLWQLPPLPPMKDAE